MCPASSSSFVENTRFEVLVTGASGYVASHCVRELLQRGYRVRGTVRNAKCWKKVDPLLRMKYADKHLTLVEADLLQEGDWKRVVDGCDFVLHVASPWPIVATADTVKTAVDGTLNVLKAAALCSSVKKVVLTSSCAAINDGHKNDSRVFDETCWTNLDNNDVEYYARSKTLAEMAAWDFWHSLGSRNKFALTVLNPTFITGPVLSDQENGSATIVGRMMDVRTYLASPRVSVGVVDVRDVARAHVIAMREPRADGERILVTAQPSVWFGDMVQWLRKEFSSQGYYITPVRMPIKFMIELYAGLGFDPMVKAVMHRIGPEVKFDNSKSREILGLTYIDPKESVIEMMYSMIEHGMVRKTRGYEKRQQKLREENNNNELSSRV